MKRSVTIGLAGALLAALVAAPALPAAALDAPRDYTGGWTLSGVSEGAESCKVNLTQEEAIGGWGLTLADDCQGKFDLSEDIAAWTVYPNGAIGFIDALRHVVLKFEPSGVGGYVAQPARGEPLSLDRATARDAALTEQQRMSGTWTLTELGGTPTCTVQLTAGADGMSGTLRKPGACRPPWARTDLARWVRKGDRITLLDRKGKPVGVLGGDSFEGFTGDTRGVFVGFIRQWDDR